MISDIDYDKPRGNELAQDVSRNISNEYHRGEGEGHAQYSKHVSGKRIRF